MQPTGSPRRVRALAAAALVVIVGVAVAGCTRPGTGWPPRSTTTLPTTTTTAAPNPVTFDLAEFTIVASSGTVQAGANVVTVRNVGQYTHEIIFIKADSAASLPTKANGAVDMAQVDPTAVTGPEHLHLSGGQSATETVTFTPGKWVAICNIEHEGNSHFARGQWMEFTVS